MMPTATTPTGAPAAAAGAPMGCLRPTTRRCGRCDDDGGVAGKRRRRMPRGIGKTRPRCWATTTATCGVVQALIVVILERGGSVHESIRHLETIIVTCATFTLAKSGANFTASPGAAAHTRVLHGGGGVRRRRARHRCWYIRWRGRVSDVPAADPAAAAAAAAAALRWK